MEHALKQTSLRALTFIVTFASMVLGLSLMILFPQPLPIIISFLIAFVTFKNHARAGMSIGSLLIGLGMMYHLSKANIISQMSALPLARALSIIVLLILFVAIPFLFNRYEDAIAIDLGIIAATLLFFGQTYYLAIPLILIAAALFKKTKLGLTLSYYVLISVPLQIMQYLKHILTLSNIFWWEDPTADPFLYVPLTGILGGMQESMTQIRLIEVTKVLETIAGQVTFSPETHMAQTTEAVLTRYFDSLPGIVLFLVIVIGLVSATALITRALVTKSHGMHSEMLLPAMTAASATALFFLLLDGLQGPLAFRAEISSSQMAIGILATSIFTILASMVSYTPKRRTTIEMRSKMIMEKTKDLARGRLQVLESLLNKTKSSIPIDVSSTEGKMLMIKDTLNDTLAKTSARFYGLSELEEKSHELDNAISNEIDNLMSELDVRLKKYQIYVNSEYLTWIKKLEEIGLDVKTTAIKDFQKELPLEMRIDLINEVLEGGRFVAIEVVHAVEQIYDIIRSLCDPRLPTESLTITFAKQKLDEKKAPWIALDALFTSINNWEKQYGAEISKSVEYLQKFLAAIASLSNRGERLLPVLGDNFSKLLGHMKSAEAIKIGIEKKTLNVMNVLIIKDALQSSLRIARDVLSILYEELTSKEESIESLLPTSDYLWGKNVALRERMASEMEMIFNPSKYKLAQVMKNLPKSLSYLDEFVETIAMYHEKEELLLNYPIAKTAIEDLLKEKKHISAQDLPFEPEYANEYLKLFRSQRYREFSFDKTKMLLMRKA
jgi:hypothetical protein